MEEFKEGGGEEKEKEKEKENSGPNEATDTHVSARNRENNAGERRPWLSCFAARGADGT